MEVDSVYLMSPVEVSSSDESEISCYNDTPIEVVVEHSDNLL